MSRYRELFLSETREHLHQMNRLLVALEQTPADPETINALFREAHSVKGMAASMGFEQTATLAHHLEDALDGFRRGNGVPAAAIDRLLAGLDLLEGLLEDLQADRPERDVAAFLAGGEPVGRPSPPPAPAVPEEPAVLEVLEVLEVLPAESLEPLPVGEAAAAAGEASPATVTAEPVVALPVAPVGMVFQVTVELAEDAALPAARGLLVLRELERSGEILSATPTREALRQGGACRQLQVWLRTAVPKARLEESLRGIADVASISFVDDRRTGNLRRGSEPGRSVRVRTDLLDQVVNLAGELLTRRYMLQRAATARDWGELDAALGETTRLLGELHHQLLQVRLMPVETITGRLPRLVRDLARKSGKSVAFKLVGGDVSLDRLILEELADPLVHLVRNAVDHGIADQGEVTIAARREKDLVLIEVSDSGRGMDPAELRRQAVARGVLSAAEAARYADREALMLVCLPGFSTATTVTDTSGRGVGMDVVKSAVEKLGGTLDIHSTVGEGTCFQLRLPLAAAIIRLLMVSCRGQLLAIPLTRVQRTVDLPEAAPAGGFAGDDAELALVDLGALLGLGAGAGRYLVLCEAPGGRRVGLQVDGLFGQREAFVKPLGFPFDRLPGISGATIDADGSVIFIVDPHPLLAGRVAGPSASNQELPHALS